MGDDDKKYSISYSTEGSIDGISETDSTFTISIDNDQYTSTYEAPSFAPTYTFDDYDAGPGKWPSEYDLEKMIEIYPALKIQYLKFIEVYNLVKDDYKNRGVNEITF
jgi:hypothetical protein